MQYVTAAQTVDAISINEAADVIAATYRAFGEGRVVPSSPSAMRVAGPPHRLQVKGAVLDHEGIAGARLSSLTHPRLILWDLNTGAPVLFLEENWLYRFRTGISGAVVARWLTPCDRPRIALIGAGSIATHMAQGFIALCDPQRLSICARSTVSAARLADTLRAPGLQVEAAADLEDVVRSADVVATITTAQAPIVDASWIKPGALVLSMGGGEEFEVATWQGAAHRFVDDVDYALYRGDLAAWVTAGRLTREEIASQISGTVGDIACGRWRGRARPQETIYAIVQGLTALDLALALAVARKLGNGRT